MCAAVELLIDPLLYDSFKGLRQPLPHAYARVWFRQCQQLVVLLRLWNGALGRTEQCSLLSLSLRLFAILTIKYFDLLSSRRLIWAELSSDPSNPQRTLDRLAPTTTRESHLYCGLIPSRLLTQSSRRCFSQVDWLKADLAAVNRTLTPWVVVGMQYVHLALSLPFIPGSDDCPLSRPWYVTPQAAPLQQQAFETLLYNGGADVVLSGELDVNYAMHLTVG